MHTYFALYTTLCRFVSIYSNKIRYLIEVAFPILMNDRSGSFKVISLEDARSLMDQGWQAADLHVHTLCSPDVIPARSLHPEALYHKAREMGMGFVTFTDHDTMDAYDIVGWNREGLVTGVEIKIRDVDVVGHTIHLNVYDLSRGQFQEQEEIARDGDLTGLLACLKKCDLPFIYNHPLWFEPGEVPNLSAVPKVVKLFPAVEYNMHRIRRKNEIAMELARKYGKGLVAATDTHSGMIGKIYTIAQGDTFGEFFKNILNGRSCIAVKDLTKQDLINEINAWIDLVFSPDLAPYSKDCTTGTKYLDRLISAMESETLRDFPRICRYALSLCHKISNSGLPASLYLRFEGSLIPEIEMQLASILAENAKCGQSHSSK